MAISSDSWKKILLFGSPALIAVLTGVYYYYYHASKEAEEAKEQEPKEESPQLAAVNQKNRGNKFFKVGRYDKAIECYTLALEQCPLDSVTDRATFYQNRAAARENLGEFESAIADCNSSLELNPTYVKALNRRARLLGKTGNLQGSLLDITACCLLEKFKNNDTVQTMDHVLKEIAKELQKAEPTKSHHLPSADFIKFYLGAWTTNIFSSEAMKIPGRKSVLVSEKEEKKVEIAKVEERKTPAKVNEKGDEKEEQEKMVEEEGQVASEQTQGQKADEIVPEEKLEERKEVETAGENGTTKEQAFEEAKEKKEAEKPNMVKEPKLPSKLIKAYEELEGAFEKMKSCQYDEAWKLVSSSVKNFSTSMNVDLHLFEKSPIGDYEKPESARARALLLDATFKALSGNAEEAKTRFLSIGDNFFAHPSIRVNALIKAASLFMTLEQDISSCMYTFQQAQTLDPICADVYIHRGQTNLLTGNLAAAEKDFSEAIRLQPNCSVAHAQRLYMRYRKAALESRVSECEKIVNDFKLLQEKFPTCIETISIFAQVLTEMGEFEKADNLYAKLIELTPTSGMPYAQRGVLHLRLKQDPVEAEKLIEKGLEVDPRCEMAWELLGQLAMERGQHEKALESFQRALDESSIISDRQHLFALREGVKAQLQAAKKYNLNLVELYGAVREDLQATMMQAMAEGYGGLTQFQ
ncbi:unnamed protein product [Hymenolepis diminuta]|uniref:Mitochondrial import receptor subunit TOM70 n=1 Tax=Hymenolepis diminuta TaxID=6216 RepID=A0A0R3ST72_HYMDI|nr:unnamed protein product [Hymenolepis diminuta]